MKSYKNDGIDRLKLYRAAGVEEVNAWTLDGKDYGKSLIAYLWCTGADMKQVSFSCAAPLDIAD